MKSAGQVVIDAALGHLPERGSHNVEQLRVAAFHMPLHQQINGAGMRKLGRSAESAMLRIKHLHCRFNNAVKQLRPERAGFSRKRFRLADGQHHVVCGFLHIGQLLPVGLRQGQKHALEAGTAVAIFRRKISAAIIWLAFRGKKSCKRPATLSTDGLHR